MTDVLIHNFEYIMKARERIIMALFGLCLAAAGTYGYFVEKTIMDTVALRSVQSGLSDGNQSLNSLSAQYVAVSSKVTLDSALAEGYAEAPVSAFVAVPAAPAAGQEALSMNAF